MNNEYIEDSGHICEYGCGQKAHYQFKNGKWCCEESTGECPNMKKRIGEKSKGKKYKKYTKPEYVENSGHVCNFGCKQKAHYYFKTSKRWCCENSYSKCPNEKEKMSTSHRKGRIPWNKGKTNIFSKDSIKKISNSCMGRIPWNLGKRFSYSEKDRYRIYKNQRYNIKDYQEKHPLFYKVEELREDPISGEIQGHCKNHNCSNSKEKGGWFTPSKTQIGERIRQLEHKDGNDGAYFYCSEHCKLTCDVYGKRASQIIKQDLINAGHIEEDESSLPGYGIWRDEIFRRNKETYGKVQCEICGVTINMIAHHIYPRKPYPHMALDPDNGLIVCPECHLKKCHPKRTPCSYGELAKLVCEKRYRKGKNEQTTKTTNSSK